ncbi:hypothetical protein CAOG_06210 [Capsaspora owczarzaki ATCC 30864]|uniref:START domain-containing protein n=1 Tax=Capsaspora owczarzaki (strain ATCC 30864) TaxID=595528 RepID=A0A0D2WTI1_CAPO3|nr:hypothetical protein CAOG_06210 [Capsaspora owczarzaki ATCC 30864]KJE95795.1 hypothetical protein CAOG_006210 [Capsaspora owczarzaki ATCC 30864]|eukprot:XP_004345800.1 hypothetical protein CAOG_06210 [Capsaspora owczarzaki ATCC 30864]
MPQQRVQTIFSDIPASVLYDALHDPDYRKVWDDNMIQGFDLFHLDANNDVGYYAARLPAPLKNRDFLNQRSWFAAADGSEYIIMNHTVAHDECPPKKEFIRAVSILTGYLVRPSGESSSSSSSGCQLTYITQTDPRGSIPKALVNKGAAAFAPKIMTKLYETSKKYPAWKEKNNPDHKPWIKFDASKTRVVSVEELKKHQTDVAASLGAKDDTVVTDDTPVGDA